MLFVGGKFDREPAPTPNCSKLLEKWYKLEEAWQHSCQTPLFQVGTWLLAQSQ